MHSNPCKIWRIPINSDCTADNLLWPSKKRVMCYTLSSRNCHAEFVRLCTFFQFWGGMSKLHHIRSFLAIGEWKIVYSFPIVKNDTAFCSWQDFSNNCETMIIPLLIWLHYTLASIVGAHFREPFEQSSRNLNTKFQLWFFSWDFLRSRSQIVTYFAVFWNLSAELCNPVWRTWRSGKRRLLHYHFLSHPSERPGL